MKLKQIFLKPINGIQRSEQLIPMVRFPTVPVVYNAYLLQNMTKREQNKKLILEPVYH